MSRNLMSSYQSKVLGNIKDLATIRIRGEGVVKGEISMTEAYSP